jgi:hypothetical protein
MTIHAETSKAADLQPSQPSEPRLAARVLASVLPLTAMLLMLGEVLTPVGLDKPTFTLASVEDALRIAEAHTSQLYVSNLMVIFGLGGLAVSFAAIATLPRGRGASLAIWAAVIGGTAAFSGALANMIVGFNLASAAASPAPTAAAASVQLAGATSAVCALLLAMYLGGGLIAITLMGVALWRSNAVPRWLPVLFGAGLILAATSMPGITAILLQLPFAVAMTLLAIQVWNAPSTRTTP